MVLAHTISLKRDYWNFFEKGVLKFF
jgi:hypothetical protein